MGRRRQILENIGIESIAAEGKSIGKKDGQVIFVNGLVPGDVADILVTKKKKSYLEGKTINIRKYSEDRIIPFCAHHNECGGCKWQHIPYEMQTAFKHQQVIDSLQRIAKVNFDSIMPIIPAEKTRAYRNKLEYTFSSSRWLTAEEISSGEDKDRRGVGFHVPGRFDRIVDVNKCHLQEEPTNDIRNALKAFAIQNNLSFYNVIEHKGFLRNLIIRNTEYGEWMVIVQFGANDEGNIASCLNYLKTTFPQIDSLYYVVNTKKNDTFLDLKLKLWHGKAYILEKLGGYLFKISPKSFFQTNTLQAEKLYQKTLEFAGLSGNEIVYDLFTGTGTIANFLAEKSYWTIGIETVPEAIEDARENAQLNNIKNVSFYTGDAEKMFNETLFEKHGIPDVVVTDPPRAGMHKNVIDVLIMTGPKKIVYVSCNPATQARDVALLEDHYNVKAVQPVDMFPHTHHVENIILLEKRL